MIAPAWRFAASFAAVLHGPPALTRALPAPVFRPAVRALAGLTPVPILLPARLPARLRAPNLIARADTQDTGYAITLQARGMLGNAGYAAGFFGHPGHLVGTPGDAEVRLRDGTRAVFRPISCGGSCAPANLWWERVGVVYNVQITLPVGTRRRGQIAELLVTANSMVPAAERAAASPGT